MEEKIHTRIRNMFDVPIIQNNLRGLWVEAMIFEILGSGWKHTGNDWSGWDIERDDDLRVEIKQSALQQTWGRSTSPPSFNIAAAKGHYPDGKTYVLNPETGRIAHVYIFAFHDGTDQRDVSQWEFYVIESKNLPDKQKSLGLNSIKKMTQPIRSSTLRERMMQIKR